MADQHARTTRLIPPSSSPSEPTTLASGILMLAGLLGGYGLFAWIGARFMLPARTGQVKQLFVTARRRSRGRRHAAVSARPTAAPSTSPVARRSGRAEDFIALSSTCPHLGCQVRWEGQNNRYFCPCHNGTFDPSGKATGGPPGDAGLSLPRYTLAVAAGVALYRGADRAALGRRSRPAWSTSPRRRGPDTIRASAA